MTKVRHHCTLVLNNFAAQKEEEVGSQETRWQDVFHCVLVGKSSERSTMFENSLLWMCSSPFPFNILSPNKGDGEGSTDCNNQVRVLWQAGAVVTRLDVFLRVGSGWCILM